MSGAELKEKLEKELPPTPYTEVELFQDPEIAAKLKEAEEITRRMKVDETRLKELKPELEAYLAASALPNNKMALWDGIVLKIGHGTSPSQLSKQKLVEKGVSIDILAECMTSGSSYTFIQFDYPKPKKAGK